jgi:Right handed beta helix region
MKKLLTGFFLLFLIVFAASSPSNAQQPSDVTWVSGSGTDFNGNTNTCESFESPCATFQNAYIHTNPGGTINCTGGFGFSTVTFTIAQSITIDCRGAMFALDASGVDYITMNAGPNDDVTIRGIQFDSSFVHGGLTGVKFIGGHSLHIENCTFNGLTTAGVSIMPTTVSKVFIADSKFRTNASGVLVKPSTGASVAASFVRVAITSNNGGGIKIDTTNGPVTADIAESEISGNGGNGLNAVGGAGGPAIFNIHNSVIAKNAVAGIQVNGAMAAAMIDTTLLDSNATGATSVVAGGHMLTYGNNRIVGTAGSGFTGSASLQ